MASFCDKCGLILSDSERINKIRELAKRREKADKIMDVATKYPEMMKMLEEILKKEQI